MEWESFRMSLSRFCCCYFSQFHEPFVFGSLATLSPSLAMEQQRLCVAVMCLLWCFLAPSVSFPDPVRRKELIELEASMRTGGHRRLSPEEQQLDAHLSKLKREEMARQDFPPALHFFKARPLIRSSPIYTLLKEMPKGTS